MFLFCHSQTAMTAWTSRAPIAASVATPWPATRVSVCLATREKTANQVGPAIPENRTTCAFYAFPCCTITKRVALVCCSYPRRVHTTSGQGRSAIGQCRTGECRPVKQHVCLTDLYEHVLLCTRQGAEKCLYCEWFVRVRFKYMYAYL